MRVCKTRFWNAMQINPMCDPDHVTLAAALQLTNEKKLKAWWEKPGFSKWFSTEDEFETKVSVSKFTAIDTLVDVMMNPDSAASARVAAAKQILDFSLKLEKPDDKLEEMLKKITGASSAEDLKKYLS